MKLLTIILFALFTFSMNSQIMTNTELYDIINKATDEISGDRGRWQFQINEKVFIVLTDSINNRMRIISPITETINLEKDMLTNALIANFHSALDVKYAISEGVLWSAFIHPLRELTEQQVKDAINQVYYANVNFGTTYASTPLSFTGNNPKNNKPKANKIKLRKT